MEPLIRSFRPALVLLAAFTLLTGVIYPLAMTGFAQVAMPGRADGSLITRDGQTTGSSLLAQSFEGETYFWPRPSAAGFAADASTGSNLGPASPDLRAQVEERAAALRTAHGLAADAVVPAELVTTSGSGLDPHLSPDAARFQAERVATARGVAAATVLALIEEHTEGRQFGVLGEPRVNVLELNLALDRMEPAP